MQLERYEISKSLEVIHYTFFSVGPKGRIKKVVEFYREEDFAFPAYNLAFGDWNDAIQQIDDMAITNNDDTDMVLTTVAAVVFQFMKENPRRVVFAQGSTPSRTRLYQINIAKFFAEINSAFHVDGSINDIWEPFQKGRNYEAFLLRSK